MMKISTILFFLSLSVQGRPINLNGHFDFSGNIEVASAVENIIVHALNDQGKRRLKDLKANGYQCRLFPRSTYKCSKIVNNYNLPQSKLEKVEKDFSNMSLYFDEVSNGYGIINDGDFYKRYEVYQEGVLNNISFDKYEYSIASYGDRELHKIIINIENKSIEFIVENAYSLTSYFSIGQNIEGGFMRLLIGGEFLN